MAAPPSVIILPVSGPYGVVPPTTTQAVAVTITWCDSIGLMVSGHGITFNGNDVTSQFTFVAGNPGGGNCTKNWTSTGTVTLDPGGNSLAALATGIDFQQTREIVTYTLSQTSAPLEGVTVTAAATEIHLGPGQTGTATFTVTNIGTAVDSFDITVACGGLGTVLSSCGTPNPTRVHALAAEDSSTVTVGYVAGSAAGTAAMKVTAAAVGAPTATATGETDFFVTKPVAHSVQVTPVNPGILRDAGYCLDVAVRRGEAVSCGDLRYVHGLPAVRTYNRVHQPVLIYQSQAAHPFWLAAALVTADTTKGTIDSVIVRLDNAGASLDHVHLSGTPFAHGAAQRVLLGVDEFGNASSVLSRVIVAITYPHTGGPTLDSVTVNGQIQSAQFSHVGRGWLVGGLESLIFYPLNGSSRDSAALYWTTSGGDARYYQPVYGGTRFLWRTTKLVGADSTIQYDSTHHLYTRAAPHGVQVVFDSLGRHIKTIDRVGRVTRFYYVGTTVDLDHIALPVPTDTNSAVYRYTFAYDTSGYLATVTAPGQNNVTRVVTLTHDASKNLVKIVDPDGSADSLTYGTGPILSLLTAIRDTRSTWSKVTYDSALKVRQVMLDTLGLRITTNFFAQQSAGFNAALNPDSAYTAINGPRTDTIVVTKIWLDAFGGPIRIQDPLGDRTLITRGNAIYPGLATRLHRANGQVLGATYDARGNPATITDSSTVIGGTYATTSYLFDGRWDFDTLTTLPAGEQSHDSLNAVGSVVMQQLGSNASRRTYFAYNGPCSGLVSDDSLAQTPRDAIVYDSLCNLGGKRTSRHYWTTYANDALGRDSSVLVAIDAADSSMTLGSLPRLQEIHLYDVMGRDTADHTVGPAYNGVAQQTAIVHSNYDSEGNVVSVIRSSTPSMGGVGSLRTVTVYDRAQRAIVDSAVNATATTRSLDAAGNVTSLVTRRGFTIVSTYNARNDLIKRIVPSFTAAVIDSGIPVDNLAESGAHQDTSANQLTRYISSPYGGNTVHGDTVGFTYDAVGQLIEADNLVSHVSRQYAANGRLEVETQALRTLAAGSTDFTKHVYRMGYHYDLDGRRDSLYAPVQVAQASLTANLPTTVQAYAYNDTTGWLQTITDAAGVVFTFAYTPRGDLRQTAYGPTGYQQRLAHDADGNIVHDVVGLGSSDSSARAAVFRYDAREKLLFAGNTADSSLRDTTWTWYSGLGFVARDSSRDINGTLGISHEHFGYDDAFGNREYDSTTNATNPRSIISTTNSWSYSTTGLLTGSVNGTNTTDVIRYDTAGNTHTDLQGYNLVNSPPVVHDRVSFYSAEDRLVEADYRVLMEPGETSPALERTDELYFYDALGRRVLVQASRTCGPYTSGLMFPWRPDDCRRSFVHRTAWDGSAELAEFQVEDSVPLIEIDTGVVELQYDTAVGEAPVDNNPFYGQVLYTNGPAVDRPLGVIRLNYSDRIDPNTSASLPYYRVAAYWIAPLWNVFGRDEAYLGDQVTTTGLSSSACITVQGTARCPFVPIQPGFTTYNNVPTSGPPSTWQGTLLEDKLDQVQTNYRRARAYDPATGRFTQEDPAGLAGGINAYGFANGDPVNYDDPFGLCPPNTVCPDDYDPQAAFAGLMGGMQLANTATPIIEGAGVAATAPLTISGDAALVTLGLAGKAASETATLFRGVSAAEAADVVAQGGKLRAGAAAAGNEGKYLTNTVEAAAKWAAQNGEGSRVLSITVPADATRAFTPLGRLDGIGQAWWAPMGALKSANVHVLQSLLTP